MKRLLVIINSRAGVGYGPSFLDDLRQKTVALFSGQFQVTFQSAKDHREIEESAHKFLIADPSPAIILAGGGGGTLCAVINGICTVSAGPKLPDQNRIVIGALRMGSGNVLARYFGAPADPFNGLELFAKALEKNLIKPCCIGKYEFVDPQGLEQVRYAATLAGFGFFGRVPGMLSRFHSRNPGLYRMLVKIAGIEKMTSFEYAGSLLIQGIQYLFGINHPDQIFLTVQREREISIKLFAGAVMNFPIKSLPFDVTVSVSDETVEVFFLPLKAKRRLIRYLVRLSLMKADLLKYSLAPGDTLRISVSDQTPVEFFLDEDSFFFQKQLSISPAGLLHFIRI
jgi:hypothetical protein